MRARREKLGLSMRDVEAILNGELSNAYLSQLENGKIKSPSAHVVLMLCAAYGVSHEDALSWLTLEHGPIPVPKLCGECGRPVPPPYAIDGARA